jgi:SSS family solute:Na+ symporter
MGLFWKKATSKGAIIGVVASIPVALLLKADAVNLPWMDQMLYTLLITMVIIAGVSLSTSKTVDDKKGIPVTAETFKTSSAFNIGAYAIILVLVVLYTMFW